MINKRIHIDPTWSFRDEAGNTLEPQLFALLQAIANFEKLTEAAESVAISYRHAWNLLKKWSDFFGADLVSLERGRGAQLTPLGHKLLWAEQRVKARFQPQMANIASELNVEIHKALADIAPILKIQASHGYAVALLPEACADIQLDLQYSSPLEALESLNRSGCDLAGFHLPSDVAIPSMLESYQRLIKPRAFKVIRFVSRQQGLILPKGNPEGIQGLADLVVAKNDSEELPRFINRQEGSGTRALLDQLLIDAGISAADIPGYDTKEFTHSAIAAHVAAGMADVGFGVEEAAFKFDLDFIPVCKEDYLFVCHNRKLKQASVESFLQKISSVGFKQKVEGLAGYDPDRCGDVEDVLSVLSVA